RELIVSDEAKTMIEDLGKFVTLKEYYKFYIKMKKEKQNTSTYGPIISILSQIEAYWFQEDRIWKNIINSNSKIHTYFVTRFDENKTKKTPYLDNLYFKVNIAESTTGIVIKKSNEYAVLKGIIKPISGIYALHEIKEIKVVYEAAQESRSVISTERDGSGGHSVSPFTFHIADNLIKRSQKYYDAKLFMLSALLAKEAYEILNGFHLMMALQSIYLRAIAETSLVTNTLGVEEDRIAKNISLIISDVRSHVDRICVGNVNAKKNILTQVFNDIRHICRNKEQFKAADIALAELINTRFGSSLWK
ncbi:MAG: hypothetical protein NTW16_04740, partial [Bacteroidetes bacterium]|nr:hypothetical protein [Bacteroidota bacterium]